MFYELYKMRRSGEHEIQSDFFALNHGLGRPLQMALLKIWQANGEFPFADRLFAAFHYSHPHPLERIARLQQGRRPRTFLQEAQHLLGDFRRLRGTPHPVATFSS